MKAEAQANTRHTFTTAITNADGSGELRIERIIDGQRTELRLLRFGPENEAEAEHVEFWIKEGTPITA